MAMPVDPNRPTAATSYLDPAEEREWVETFVRLWKLADRPTIESRAQFALGPLMMSLAHARNPERP